jgi:hypothetical protein
MPLPAASMMRSPSPSGFVTVVAMTVPARSASASARFRSLTSAARLRSRRIGSSREDEIALERELAGQGGLRNDRRRNGEREADVARKIEALRAGREVVGDDEAGPGRAGREAQLCGGVAIGEAHGQLVGSVGRDQGKLAGRGAGVDELLGDHQR